MSVSPVAPSDKDAVDMILGLAGLSVNEDESARLVRMYPILREQAAALRIPEVRYAEPAIVYPAR